MASKAKTKPKSRSKKKAEPTVSLEEFSSKERSKAKSRIKKKVEAPGDGTIVCVHCNVRFNILKTGHAGPSPWCGRCKAS